MIDVNTKKRIKTTFALLLFSILMISYNFFSVYILIVFGVISILEFLILSNKIFKKDIISYLINILFISYISFFCYFFYYFLNFLHLKIILFILLFGCVGSDIGGFLAGKIFKGPRLTKISPNKTYSGVIGSIFFASLIVSISTFIFTNSFSYLILFVALMTSVGCQIGDLFFSFLKRKAKIKDTGKLLPGHGGILDRIDGMLLGIPVGFISLIVFN